MLIVIYLILGYWAVGRTILRNTVMYSSDIVNIWRKKLIYGFIFGWFCIPWAILGLIFGRH